MDVQELLQQSLLILFHKPWAARHLAVCRQQQQTFQGSSAAPWGWWASRTNGRGVLLLSTHRGFQSTTPCKVKEPHFESNPHSVHDSDLGQHPTLLNAWRLCGRSRQPCQSNTPS